MDPGAAEVVLINRRELRDTLLNSPRGRGRPRLSLRVAELALALVRGLRMHRPRGVAILPRVMERRFSGAGDSQ
jgi:hypothetical protein